MQLLSKLRANWFYLLLPLCLLAAWQLARSGAAIDDPLTVERVFLFDFGIFLPTLYFFFLRQHVGVRAAAIRSMLLGLAGLWYAGFLMPTGEGQLLPWLGWLRMVALPVVIIVEIGALIAAVRIAFSAEPDEQQLVRQGMPPLLVKLMLAEARFWKAVWRFLSGR